MFLFKYQTEAEKTLPATRQKRQPYQLYLISNETWRARDNLWQPHNIVFSGCCYFILFFWAVLMLLFFWHYVRQLKYSPVTDILVIGGLAVFRRSSRSSSDWKVGGLIPGCSVAACQTILRQESCSSITEVWTLDRQHLGIEKSDCMNGWTRHVVKSALSSPRK